MSGRYADLRIHVSCTQLVPGSISGSGCRLRLTPINESELWIHFFNLGGCYDLQNKLSLLHPTQSQAPHIFPHLFRAPRTQRRVR